MTIMQQLEKIREALKKCQMLMSPAEIKDELSNQLDEPKIDEVEKDEMTYPEDIEPSPEDLLSLEAQEEPKEFEK